MRRALVAVGCVAALGIALFFVLRGKHAPPAPAAAPAPAATTPGRARPAAPARALASVAGKVTDAAGAPVAGAVVRLAPEDEARGAVPPAIARSGADGTFRLADLDPGRWRASATAGGFVPAHVGGLVLEAGKEGSLAFRLEAGGRLVSGTVTDRTGGPVAGALVEASPLHGLLSTRDPHTAAALTDAAGKYAIPVGEGRHRLAASHPEYVGEARTVEVGAAGATEDFDLMPGGVIEGIVRELGTGTPVAGAEVAHAHEAVAHFLGAGLTLPGATGVVTADGDGRFRITGLSPGAVRLTARGAGLATRTPTVVPLGVAGQLAGVEVFVGGAFAVRGTVTIEGGEPAAGATVRADGDAASARAIADAHGRFVLDGLPPDDLRIRATAPELLPDERPVRVSVRDHDVDGVKLVVRRGATIVGRVEPPGIAEVAIKQDVEPGSRMMRIAATASTLTAPDGTFALGPVEPRALVVEAHAADGRRGQTEVTVPPAGATGVVIRLEPRAGLSGRVLTAAGTPMAGVTVYARRVEGDRHVTRIVNGVDVSAERAPTGAGGAWAMLGLAPGTYELDVHDDTGEQLAFADGGTAPEVTLKEGERRDGIDLTVEVKDGVIRGVVLAPDGKPLPDAWVSATPSLDIAELSRKPGTHVSMRMVVSDDEGGVASGAPAALTDAAGRFEIAGLRRGKYRLVGEGQSGAARGTLDGVPTGADVQLPLATLTRLEGKVTAGGKPVDEFTVVLMGPVQRSQTFTAAGGAFALERVDPGSYTVRVSGPAGTGQADVAVTAGQTAQVAVALVSFGKVVGKVVGADGAPAAGFPVLTAPVTEDGKVMLQIQGEPPATATDGSFAIEAPSGKSMLFVLAPHGLPAVRRPIEVVSGQTLDVGTVKLEPAGPRPPAPQKLRAASL
jgi:hypothetical protein